MSAWIHQLLKTHLSEDQLKQMEPYLYAESWASPSARHRVWFAQKEEIPLRYHLEIELKS